MSHITTQRQMHRLIDVICDHAFPHEAIDTFLLHHIHVDWDLIVQALTMEQFMIDHPDEDMDEDYYALLDSMNAPTVLAHTILDDGRLPN